MSRFLFVRLRFLKLTKFLGPIKFVIRNVASLYGMVKVSDIPTSIKTYFRVLTSKLGS